MAGAIVGAERALSSGARRASDPALDEHAVKALLVFLHEAEHGAPPDQRTLDDDYSRFMDQQIERQQETVALHRRTRRWLDANVELHGIGNLLAAAKIAQDRGTGIVVGTTFTGSFTTGRTRLAQELRRMGYPPEVVQMTQRFPVSLLHRAIAWRFGLRLISYAGKTDEQRSREQRRALTDAKFVLPGNAVFVAADVDIVRPLPGHAAVQFLGHELDLARGPLRVAGEDAPIVVMGTSRGRGGKLEVHVSEPLDPRAVPEGERPQRLADLVADAWQRTDAVLHPWGAPKEIGAASARSAGLRLPGL